jgi:hypothetical protein
MRESMRHEKLPPHRVVAAPSSAQSVYRAVRAQYCMHHPSYFYAPQNLHQMVSIGGARAHARVCA